MFILHKNKRANFQSHRERFIGSKAREFLFSSSIMEFNIRMRNCQAYYLSGKHLEIRTAKSACKPKESANTAWISSKIVGEKWLSSLSHLMPCLSPNICGISANID